MAAEVVLLASLAIAAALLVVASSRLREGLARRWGALAALPLLIALLLILYVFGEDSYRGNGISRWDAYHSPGGALGPMFVLSIALLCACAGLLLYAGLRGRAACCARRRSREGSSRRPSSRRRSSASR